MAGSEVMTLIALLLATLAALLHVLIFAFESLLWTQESVWRRFGVSSLEQAQTLRPMAFNQGFYNLFLAIGTGVGVACLAAGQELVGWTLIVFGCASMLGAAVALVSTGPQYRRAAATQGALPLLALVAALIAWVS
jgi:putative membrane protein